MFNYGFNQSVVGVVRSPTYNNGKRVRYLKHKDVRAPLFDNFQPYGLIKKP